MVGIISVAVQPTGIMLAVQFYYLITKVKENPQHQAMEVKELGGAKKTRPQNCYMETCSPHPPATLPWGKRTHFHPLCPKLNIVWGEKIFFWQLYY